MSNNVVLVTGSSSFTGYYVIKELELHGYHVIKETVDLRDYNSVLSLVKTIKPDYVIHLAAISFVAHEDINNIYETNLLGTINLLKALVTADLPMKKVILASSANIYGNTTIQKISESQAANPANHYGISKFAMEMAANQYKDKLPILITRPFNYTGVGQAESFLIPKIIKHFQSEKTVIELGNIDVYRDFSDVRDIAKWYVSSLNSDNSITHVNFCSGTLTSLEEIIAELNNISGYEIDVQVNPNFVRKNEIKKLCGNNQLLNSLVNVKSRIAFTDTLRWMYNEY
ncbi:GDP-mannose 4,6-dehydratase [Pseudocolwellia sp. HL-MZ19]|uniref:GDP-mannose 4,6-dehydratase n=1 Tax=Pseudocolwellia sp. HL-MZ19 TaxID=3400846 RepID=UPI003CE8A1DF